MVILVQSPSTTTASTTITTATTTTSTSTLLGCRKSLISYQLPTQRVISPKTFSFLISSIPIPTLIQLPPLLNNPKSSSPIINHEIQFHNHHHTHLLSSFILGSGFTLLALLLASSASAAEFPQLVSSSSSSLQLNEPQNALSLPTWAIHVSSVVEWVTAMILVWQYGEKSGYESWKGLSWGMVPLLGGAFCACTWHFFYNSESLSILVALQAALTVIGNFTMCIAAFRIYKSFQESSEKV